MPVTFTEKLQLAFESRPRPFSEIKFVPGVAVTLPAVTPVPSVKQVPVTPFGVATVSPDGSVSEKPIFVRFVLLFGFAILKVSEVVPPTGMAAAPKALFNVGGDTTGAATTLTVAVLLVDPGPLSFADTGPVVLLWVPKPVANRFTAMLHVPPPSIAGGVIVPPEKLIDELPDTAVSVPPQSLLALFGVATTRPAGSASV